jgi:pantoate--beta-alanine ligase
MRIVETFAEARSLCSGAVSLVPTMGFLHEGHLSLVDAARSEGAGTIVMSLFVNPLQFDEQADLDRYPRDLDRDAGLAADRGVDVLFAPPVEEVYPQPPLTSVVVGEITDALEGAFRPGHFEGVATVVAKLFAGLRPDRAYFGRKDAQQLAVVRRMAADLSFPVDVVAVSTIREPDGLALSSRNVFLSDDERRLALGISAGLFAAADLAEGGERSAAALETAVRSRMAGEVRVEYVTLTDAASVRPVAELVRSAFLAVAARVGSTRLIDNVHFDVIGGSPVADRGIRLEVASLLYERA